jgi:hypothetical protein
MTETKPKRRWFRFSLRTVFVLVARVGVAAGWVACQLNWIQQRHEFFKCDGVSYSYPGAGAKTLVPWSLRLFGEPAYAQITTFPAEMKMAQSLFPEAMILKGPHPSSVVLNQFIGPAYSDQTDYPGDKPGSPGGKKK